MEERERRVVENESRFRLVNERIRALVSGDETHHGARTETVAVVCECGHGGCTETIEVPLDIYEWTRASSMRFVIAVGHELPEFERVVRDAEGYLVVEKFGDARNIASESDPNT